MLVAEFVKYMEQRAKAKRGPEGSKKNLNHSVFNSDFFSLVRKMVQVNNFDIIKRNSNCFDTSLIKKFHFENRYFIIFEGFEAQYFKVQF